MTQVLSVAFEPLPYATLGVLPYLLGRHLRKGTTAPSRTAWPIYLWHQTAFVLVARLVPLPDPGTPARLVWVPAFAAVLAALVTLTSWKR